MEIYQIYQDGLPFVMLSREGGRDDTVSAKAKGIFWSLATHVDGFRQTIDQIAKMHSDGVASIRTGLVELEEAGWITREQIRGPDGSFGNVRLTLHHQPRQGTSTVMRFSARGFSARGFSASGESDPIRRTREENQFKEHEEHDQRAREVAPWMPGCPKPGRKPVDVPAMTYAYFADAYCGHTGHIPATARSLYVLDYYTRDEIMDALESTASADRPSWRYFARCLEGFDEGGGFKREPVKVVQAPKKREPRKIVHSNSKGPVTQCEDCWGEEGHDECLHCEGFGWVTTEGKV